MAINYPGPWQVRLFYSTTTALTLNHVQNLNCDLTDQPGVGETFADCAVAVNNGSPKNLQTAVDEYVALFRAIFNNNMTLARAELWQMNPASFDGDFKASYSIGLTGTGSGTLQTAAENIITFRSTLGGTARLHYYQSLQSFGAVDLPPFGTASFEAVRAYVVGAGGWFVARDNGRLFSAIGLYNGQNEHIFKKIYRQ